jgi:hypothetical protein
MTWSTRFATASLEKFISEGEKAVTTYAQQQYAEAAQVAADWWSGKIPAGRGGSHAAEMKNITQRVTATRSARFFVRMGWLNHPPVAEDGKTSWFVYHDVGYDPFGMVKKGYATQRVAGLFLQIEARRIMRDELHKANDRVIRAVNAAARRQRGR